MTSAQPRYALELADALEALKRLPPDVCDSLVTDPPAGVAFMGKDWDTFKGDTRQADEIQSSLAGQFNRSKVRYGDTAGYGNKSPRGLFIGSLTPIFKEALRVLKPGAYGLVWALPRTSHWTATALEDAGFEIRDVVTHLFGTGFPKGASVGRQIDMFRCELPGRHYDKNLPKGDKARESDHLCPAHPDGDAHRGEYTNLKPGAEYWILVRKPLVGTTAENALAHGTSGLQIDACRLVTSESLNGGTYSDGKRSPMPGDTRTPTAAGRYGEDGRRALEDFKQPSGRWPANVVLSHSSSAWCTLRSDLPAEVSHVIRAYYGEEEALCILQSGILGNAIRASKTEVLFRGVHWCKSQGEEKNDVGEGSLQSMPRLVRDNTGLETERAQEILLQNLPRSSDACTPPVGSAPYVEFTQKDAGRSNGQVPAGKLVTVEGWQIHGSRGLHSHNDRRTAEGSSEVGTTDAASGVRIHSGASGNSCNDAPSSDQENRSGASPEWNQIGQPGEESTGSATRGAHYRTSSCGNEADPSTSTSETLALTVAEAMIPSPWLSYFLPAHNDGCKIVGKKKIKSHNPDNTVLVGDDTTKSAYGDYGSRSAVGHADENGEEEIDAYECEPDCAVFLLDQQSGMLKSGYLDRSKITAPNKIYGTRPENLIGTYAPDSGGASRFFYCAKASKADKGEENKHPTVKNTALMRWLCKLITPPSGTILDPFMGSGSTGVAALQEGFRFLGVEREQPSYEIAKRRVTAISPNGILVPP